MKIITKLALVSSMAVSANAMAMQSMDDAALSAATGQDGINIGIALGDNAALDAKLGTTGNKGILIDNVYVHDNDGLAAAGNPGDAGYGGTAKAGAISIQDIVITQTGTGNFLDLVIDTDKGLNSDAATNNAFLNVNATVGAMNVSLGSIGIASSNGDTGIADATGTGTGTQTAVRGVINTPNEILTGLDLSLGSISANVQLGNAPQGAMIKVDSTLNGGLAISNLGINDNSASAVADRGQIYLDNIYVRGQNTGASANSGDITVNADISVTKDGLVVQSKSDQALNVYVQGVRLGAQATGSTNSSIGDIEINGLHAGYSTITIAGH